MKRLLHIVSLVLALLGPAAVFAQDQLDLPPGYWERIRADKKAWVAQNMGLTPQEEKQFWPVYEDYQKDLAPLNRRLLKLLQTYAKYYREESLTDAVAEKLITELLAISEGQVQLQKTYVKRLSKVIPGRKVARYIQLEARMDTVIRFELAQNVPLVGDVPSARTTTPNK